MVYAEGGCQIWWSLFAFAFKVNSEKVQFGNQMATLGKHRIMLRKNRCILALEV